MTNASCSCRQETMLLIALAIIVSCGSLIVGRRRSGAAVQRSIEEAVDSWEAEGGAIRPNRDEEFA
jgi:hypothetical protein